MLTNPYFVSTDPAALRDLVERYPWATLVTPTAEGLQASHYPVLRDGDDALLTHVGKQDLRTLELPRHEVLVILQGPQGYVSTDWYPPGEFVPTWNHVTAHLTCEVEVLDADENFRVLCRLVRHFEGDGERARLLEDREADARAAARGTVGLRLRIRGAKVWRKLSQNKPPHVVRGVVAGLRRAPNDLNAQLADEMERELSKRDERAFHFQLDVTAALRGARDTGYRPTTFLRELAVDGAVAATKSLLTGDDALAPLARAGRLDASVEAHVVLPWYSGLFTRDESAVARGRLEGHGFDVDAHLAMQQSPEWAAETARNVRQ